MDDMKISFKVEITGCDAAGTKCPYLTVTPMGDFCSKVKINQSRTYEENISRLTKTCPMVRAQFEALE